ncbi:hypothetical protein [Streptomyces acidiscabies]|uniref:hypothetical protein n=1 Tax=Streptomyces acidiscabies TaxID=42234 RepID=UPI0038F5DDED
MPNSTSEKPEQPYPGEPFTTPEIIDDCGDCKMYVDAWFTHTRKRLPSGELSKDYDLSASSDDAVLWKQHRAEVHDKATR